MIWILADDRAGNVNQLLGIVEALGEPYERKDIRYTAWVRLPNFLRGASLIGITRESKKALKAPWPDVVFSAGRRSFPVALALKKASQGKTKIVQLMNPGKLEEKKADLLILPVHDCYSGKGKNVMQVLGTPHRVTPEKLAAEKVHWEGVLKQYPVPRVGLLVGGATKDKAFTLKNAADLVALVRRLKPASLLVTTSRRTPNEIVNYLQKELPEPKFFYRFGDPGENPYFGLLSWSNVLVVTGDSMSMCSECAGAGVPVVIFAPSQMVGAKHARFHQALYQQGYAMPAGEMPVPPKARLNPAREIAQKIKEFL
ncbi:MAG: mitochondrial fission ELM1 family protein [Alphaproteobacteria bacterium]